VDVSDAQLVNLYFDADEPIYQKIDTTYQDSVIIQKKNGQRLLIFDFRKGSLRY
jgi:phage major head subunit gpT-like protein